MHAKSLLWTLKPYFPCDKPGFHPCQETEQPGYEEWLAAFNKTRDPTEASEFMRVALVAR